MPRKVAGLALIDPVVMLLHLKDVLFNFLYKNEGKSILTHLIGTELFVNHALRRNFWWTRNVLWASDLEENQIKSVICLSEHDEIGPSLQVLAHVREHQRRIENSVVDSYVMRDVGHGDFCFDDAVLQGLTDRLARFYTECQGQSPANQHDIDCNKL